jgi:hypothetical protein
MAEPKGNAAVIDWSLTTWEGATRQQLRHWAALSLEEILLAQEEMAELAERFRSAQETKQPPLTGEKP